MKYKYRWTIQIMIKYIYIKKSLNRARSDVPLNPNNLNINPALVYLDGTIYFKADWRQRNCETTTGICLSLLRFVFISLARSGYQRIVRNNSENTTDISLSLFRLFFISLYFSWYQRIVLYIMRSLKLQLTSVFLCSDFFHFFISLRI